MNNSYSINIKKLKESDNGWIFIVSLVNDEETHVFTVELEKEYCKNTFGDDTSPEDAVKKSFLFLLDKEPVVNIMREFNISIIETFFPDYKEKVVKY